MNEAVTSIEHWARRATLALLAGLTLAGCQPGSAPASAASTAPAAQGPPAGAASPQVAVHLPQDGLPVIVDPTPNASFEHDEESFTQGLVFADGALYESTGRQGYSKVRRLNADTGAVEKEHEVEDQHFGEGLAVYQNRLYQLTWTSQLCFIYDLATLQPSGQLFYAGEGWGLTVSPQEGLLVFTDGSPQIRFLQPSNMVAARTITALDGKGAAVSRLNEVEWVRGEIWANVWVSDRIARIDPQTGKVKGWILLPALVRAHHDEQEDVLNGIAYDAAGDRLWLTGKLWEKVYRFDDVEKVFFTPTPAAAGETRADKAGEPSPAR